MMRTRFRSFLCMWLAGTIAAGGCRAPQTVTSPTKPVTTPPAVTADAPLGRPQIPLEADLAGRITMQTVDTKVASANVDIKDLTDGETAALHARMEPLPVLDNTAAPVMRPPSLNPPMTRNTQPIAFVAPTGKAVTDAPIIVPKPIAPLQAPQITPTDEVYAESEIRVRFSEPMVPVAQVGSQGTPKIAIKPAVTGTWKWLDSRVVQFTAAPRLPKATTYEVTVQPGITALSGARLQTATTQTFSTTPLAMAGTYPANNLRPDSPIAIRFDQDIDVNAVMAKLKLTVAKQRILFRPIALEPAKLLWARDPSKEWKTDEARLVDKRYLILLPDGGAWPAGARVEITLDKGAPSAEGPRLSKDVQGNSFDVVPAFTLKGIECQQNPNTYEETTPKLAGARCPANGWLQVAFSNPIAIASYRAEKVQIAGEEFDDHSMNGNAVGITTPKPVGRTYTAVVKGDLADIYGQAFVGNRATSFTTSPEQFYAQLYAPSGVHVLDPRFAVPQWVVRATAVSSIRVQLYRVTPADYFAFTAFEHDPKATPPGKKFFDETRPIGATFNGELRADLTPSLTGGFGHVVAVATATAARGNPAMNRVTAWIQVTHLGASARVDAEKITAFVHDLSPGKGFLAPRANVATSLVVENEGEKSRATSDATGKLELELLPARKLRTYPLPQVLVKMVDGNDSAFSVIARNERTQRVNDALWYVTDDRFTYKPGEAVYVKGWVRWTHNGPNPDLQLPKAGETVEYALTDSRGARIASGTAPLSDQGGFDVEVKLPNNINLGNASFSFRTRTDAITHPISVQEFRTPAYAVTLDDDVSHRGSIPLIVGESIEMLAGARYYAGGGLGGAAIDWNATLTTTTYNPPGWSQFEFSPPEKRSKRYYYRYRDEESTSTSQTGSLSGASTAAMTWGLAALPSNHPSVLSVDATVTDVDRMTIRASSRPILVHPSTYYVGLRLKPRSYDVIEAIVTDIDGNAVKGVDIDLAVDSVLGSERYRDDAKIISTQRCKKTSATTAVECAFDRSNWEHAFTATATVVDARGRKNVADLEIPWRGRDDKKQLDLVPDKTLYRAGDTAKVEIKSAIVPAKALVTYARQGVIEQKRIELTTPSTIIEVPVTISHIKNLYVQVDRFAKRQHQNGKDDGRQLPEQVSAEVKLDVDVESARLDVRAKPSAKLVQPGDEATFELDVAHDGKPVPGAEVALIVVDEAVLSLSSRSHADPLAPFFRDVASGTWAWHTLSMVHDSGYDVDVKPGFERHELGSGGGGTGWGSIGTGRYGTIGHGSGGGSGYVGASIVTARKDFRPTAVFSPALETDKHGHATVTVKMPDSLTRFRIVALATANTTLFGKGENTIITQRKVNARTIAPRFLTQGDRFSLPVLVQNLDTKPRTIDVAVRAANLVAGGPQGKRVTIPGGQRAEVRFDFATHARGKAVIQTIMTSGPFADASNVELPVYEPATTESFATYGIVDEGAQREQLAIPRDVFAEVGGLEVEVSSTQLQALTDAYWYLHAYPYECAEQRSSRMLATSAMYDVLDAFAMPGRPTRAELEAQRVKDLAILGKTQRPDGGWGYFAGMSSDPMVSLQVLAALGAGKANGAVLQKALTFANGELTKLFDKLGKRVALSDRTPSFEDAYSVALAAHILTNLGAAGQDARARAEKLHVYATALKAYPVDAKARVLAILAKYEPAKGIRSKLTSELISATHETAAAATVTAEYVDAERLLLVSTPKTNALVLDALIREQPDHPLIAKLARGVLDARQHGRWRTTQENLVSLQALRRYFDVYEKATPNYTGKLWLGKASYAEQPFIGRTTTRATAQATWSQLAPGTNHDLVFSRDGSAGRLYYRVGITYAPKQIELPALDAGFVVRRSYTAVDDPKDVIKNADGSYAIKLGAKVVVTIETTNTTTRHAVAVVDPLPAGFEIVNTNLATAERAAAIGDAWDHQNLRDNRAEAFDMELPAGVHRYVYTVRATTPGSFIAAPAKAEEMYAPETFGRSTGMRVTVQ